MAAAEAPNGNGDGAAEGGTEDGGEGQGEGADPPEYCSLPRKGAPSPSLSLSLILSSCCRALPRSPPSFFPPTTTISSSLVQSYVTSHRGHTRPGSDITQLPTSMSISPHRDAAAARPRLARARARRTQHIDFVEPICPPNMSVHPNFVLTGRGQDCGEMSQYEMVSAVSGVHAISPSRHGRPPRGSLCLFHSLSPRLIWSSPLVLRLPFYLWQSQPQV